MSKLPETGPSLIRHLRQQQRRMIRNENASPYTRSGTRVTGENELTADGTLRSWDYDGTSRTDLGTTGWMLGPDDGGPSLLALNGVDVYADLAAKDDVILGLIADLGATQDDLAATQDDLATAQATLATTVSTLATTVSGLATAQATLTAQQATLDAQQATLAAQVDLLTAIADVQYAETTTGRDGFTGFYTGALPTVELSSPSGRIEVAYGGSLNGGEGYFCFSVTGATSGAIVTAAAVQANPARRVAVTGGASFAPSGHRSMVVTVPADEVMTVTLAYYAADTYVYFFGGSILARVTP